eukprot:gene13509-19371_t
MSNTDRLYSSTVRLSLCNKGAPGRWAGTVSRRTSGSMIAFLCSPDQLSAEIVSQFLGAGLGSHFFEPYCSQSQFWTRVMSSLSLGGFGQCQCLCDTGTPGLLRLVASGHLDHRETAGHLASAHRPRPLGFLGLGLPWRLTCVGLNHLTAPHKYGSALACIFLFQRSTVNRMVEICAGGEVRLEPGVGVMA